MLQKVGSSRARLYFVNSTSSPQTSPNTSPADRKLVRDGSSVAGSRVSRTSEGHNHDQAVYTKSRDKHTCQFCQTRGDDSLFDAAHLCEKKVKDMTEAEKLALFAQLNIDGIDSGRNLFTLCIRKCHSKFDCNDIGFTSAHKWVVRDKLKNERIRSDGEARYGDFGGTGLMFRSTVSPALVQYRARSTQRKQRNSSCGK